MNLPCAPPTRPHQADSLRVIVIDDSRERLDMLRRLLAESLPNVEVTEYDADQQGKPGRDFDWSLYDALLIDDDLGNSVSGLDWLADFCRAPCFPPAILMAANGNEYLAARAIKLGAQEYIRQQDITTERLSTLVLDAVAEARAKCDFETTLRESRPEPHLRVLGRLAQAASETHPSDTTIGYRYVRLIGQGSSSRVYLAEKTTDGTTLVLKIIDASSLQDNQIVLRFIREAEIVSTLNSPYVVRFYDYGLTQTYGYIAMEFFTRGDLKQRIERGVSRSDTVNYMRHIALGLEAIHSGGIVHRDLKPGNIMFRADDSLALADFGISRQLNQASDLTNLGSVLGTPNYLSPEQAMGLPVDPRTDLYSAGIMLFEMLARRKPFRAESPSALVYQHVHAPTPRLPESAARFQPLVDSLLQKQPNDRLPTARHLVAALDELAATTTA